MDQTNENRARSTVTLISSGEYNAVVRPIIPRVVPVHIRAIRIRIAELKKITIGRNVVLFRTIQGYIDVNAKTLTSTDETNTMRAIRVSFS